MSEIYSVNGPVITVKGKTPFSMQEMVRVGDEKLIGEVIGVNGLITTVQVYEVTTGLNPGDTVEGTGSPICVTLGPGIVSDIFDGIERPLRETAKKSGRFLTRGTDVEPLDINKKWSVTMRVKAGDVISAGRIYATCPETPAITHHCMLSPEFQGESEVIYAAPDGEYTINDVVMRIRTSGGREVDVTLCQRWPIRTPRPVRQREPISKPLLTGQRVIDSFFPIAKGGAAAIPGGFGTGKTTTQHQLAKWCDADLIVYIGCGERGNEMTQVLNEFSELIDPRSGNKLTDRTVLIANTSNMPVAAREASIYTGITIAEYYRDMGYHVALMADSTSRWAEALREISGRLEEMPAEEGFPAYLPSRLSQFYERAGYMKTLSGKDGSVTLIGAVSPQGGDFSEPVTQNTQRFIRVFWALDKTLAYSRHYPAINWLSSYSEYVGDLTNWYEENLGRDFLTYRTRLLNLLSEESRLMEIVKLIGSDVLPDDQKLTLEAARAVRIGILQQNPFDPVDTYVPVQKQKLMMGAVLHFYDNSRRLTARGIPVSRITESGIIEKLCRMKYDFPNDDFSPFDALDREIDSVLSEIDRSFITA